MTPISNTKEMKMMTKKTKIMTIHPYRVEGKGWMFDDPTTGLKEEGLVCGIDTLLDLYSREKKLNTTKGFDVKFSNQPIKNHTLELHKQYELDGSGREHGTMYNCPQYNCEGWLCPSLYLYFEEAPETIYIKIS